ncbi:MAG TPA: high-potential iron-sulfur protein [Halothiobacillus sp.]|nr:high-potential iron-sulfur protein [Halothiobacillus sp.]
MNKDLKRPETDAMQPARRRFLSGVAASVILIPLSSIVTMRMAQAADLPHLSPSDPTAVALSYVEDATASKSPTYQKGSACDGCALYQGDRTAAWGPCAVFPGKDVAAQGWCTSFVKMS